MKPSITPEFNMFLQDKNYPLFNRAEYESLHNRLDSLRERMDRSKGFVTDRTREICHREIDSVKYILTEYENEFRKWLKERGK